MWICVGQHCTKKSLVHNRQLLWENNLFNFVSTMHRNNIGQKQQQHRNNMEQHCIEILWSHCCSNTSEAELHEKITCAMLAYNSWTTLHRKIIYNVILSYVSQHCQWTMLCNLNNVVSIRLEKHCIGIYSILSKYIWGNIAQENYFCNIGLEYTDMFLQENDLHCVALVYLVQHCRK